MKEPEYPSYFEKSISPWWKSKSFWSTAGIMIVLHFGAAALYLFASGKFNNRSRVQKPVTEKSPQKVPTAFVPSSPIRRTPMNRAPLSPANTNKPRIYSWKDEKGVSHFSDQSPSDAPPDIQISDGHADDHLGQSESLSRKLDPVFSTSRRTRVRIHGNQVLIPVRFGYRGQEIQAMLLLDTGATCTTIHRSVANRLNLWETRQSSARVADGRTVATDIGILDYIVVGPHRFRNFGVSIINYHGSEELCKGLLGMNFLSKVRYDVDFHDQTIYWR